MTTTDAIAKRKSQIQLLLIIAAFVAPLAIAWLLVGNWRPTGSVEHGELLNPVQPVMPFTAQALNGDVLESSYLQRFWTLAAIAPDADCDETCRNGLYRIRQIRLTLGKESIRVRMLLLLPEKPTIELTEWLYQEHSELKPAIADSATIRFIRDAFNKEAVGPFIYLIDPLGNLVMRYDAEVDPKSIQTDLKRLLKYSKIG